MSTSPEFSTTNDDPLPPFSPTPAHPLPPVRCSKRNSLGARCGNYATPGAEVCRRHGAQLPSVKAKAAARVEAARMRLFGSAGAAVETLESLLEPGTADAVRLKAATEVLDRVGIRAGVEIDVSVKDERTGGDRVRERLGLLANREAAPSDREIERSAEEIVDALEVDNDDD